MIDQHIFSVRCEAEDEEEDEISTSSTTVKKKKGGGGFSKPVSSVLIDLF